MSSKTRVGVVGVGYLGKIHARIYAQMPEVELVGVADLDAQAAREIAEQYRCASYTDVRQLVDKVDAVSIVVPTVAHLSVARTFLERHVHMLMEKPLASTYEEGVELVELAERAGVVFQVGHLERFNAGVMALAERVQDPRFIEVHRLGTFVERATDVDVVIDLMIHDIDIVMALVKAEIKEVAASGLPVLTPHIDIANARLEFANGAVANVTASRVSNKKQRRIRIFSGDGYYALDYAEQQLEIVRPQPRAGARAEIVVERPPLVPRPPLETELAAFIECVRTKGRPLVDGRIGLQALKTALLVKEKIDPCR